MEYPRILSLSSCFPNPSEPAKGVFVQARLAAMARLAEIKVVAPVGVFDYSAPRNRWIGSRHIPTLRMDGNLEILHPRWIYPPGGAWVNAGLMALELLPAIHTLRRHWPFDLIDAHFAFPDGIAAAVLAGRLGCPFTITLRGNETRHGACGAARKSMVWALSRAAAVVTVSGRLRDFAITLGAHPDKVKVIPNGVDAAKFHLMDREPLRAMLGWPPGSLVILSAGYLIERKGHHRIVRALKQLRERGFPAELAIAGAPGREGLFESHLRGLVSSLGLEGKVHFLGEVTPARMAELMAAADVFCLASSREGWPNVVHEASACGAPVVATDVGGVPDMLPSEDYGFVVPVQDEQRLEAALVAALDKHWNRQAISAWAHRRSWSRVADEVLAELTRVAVKERQ